MFFWALPNAQVQLQAHYHHCGEAASEKCLSAATFVRHQREVFAAALRHRQSGNQVLGLTPVSSRRAEHNARPQLQESFVQAVPLMEVATSLPSNS